MVISVIQRVFQALSGVAGFIIMGGRFGSYSVAGFNHNRWPVWVGIRILRTAWASW